MDEKLALHIVNVIFKNVFGRENVLSLDEIFAKFAFDEKLPKLVKDSWTNEDTWADSPNAHSYMTQKNTDIWDEEKGWMREKKPISSLEDLIKLWKEIDYTTTERVYDSTNVACSDTIYTSENVYRSSDCRDCKNIVFTDSCSLCEYSLACSRSGNCSFSIRVDDSGSCTNSYNVICSSKISNSFFIQDAFNLNECMFCSHIANKSYCIANMQFEKEEYIQIKEKIIDWILS